MFKNILLAVDGSEHALRAAATAAELARELKSDTLRIVVAVDPVPSFLGEPNFQNAVNARTKEADSILNAALEAVGETPGEIRTEILEGAPAEVILNVANTRSSDLIVMGSRGLGRLAGALLGSQSQKVVRHASCPVLIVR